MNTTITVLLSVAASSVVAAVFTGLLAGRNERARQLLESRRLLAGDFASETMRALSILRNYKPTTGPGHRNDILYIDAQLRTSRADAAADAIDRIRPMRGRVWVTFPGRSTREELKERGPVTTSDWAEYIIGNLRAVEENCNKFWKKTCEENGGNRAELEIKYGNLYRQSKEQAWHCLDKFCESAAQQLEHGAGALSPDHSRRLLAAAEYPQDRGDSGNFSVRV